MKTGAFARLRAEAAAISQGLDAVGSDYFDSFVPDDRVTWIAASGTVLYDSAAPAQLLESHADREEIDHALPNRRGTDLALFQDAFAAHVLLCKASGGRHRPARFVHAEFAPAMILMLLTPFLWVATLVLILCGVLSYRLARQITKPLNAINPDNPAPLPSYPELTPLFDKLREQNRTIGKQMNELQLRQREFTAITENMREGFLLVDCKMHVLSSNHSALEVLGGRELKPGCLLYDAECRQEIFDAVDTALSRLAC